MPHQLQVQSGCFIRFKESIDAYPLPERFTFPFYYTPHPLSLLAAKELQHYLSEQTDWVHNFGLEEGMEGMEIGKMFGVLVVQDRQGEIGYLAAFSGKLAGGNHHHGFVPPVFDILVKDGFYKKGEETVIEITRQIEEKENDPQLPELQQLFRIKTAESEEQLEAEKQRSKANKLARDLKRKEMLQTATPEACEALEVDLIKQSMQDQFVLKDLKKYWKQVLDGLESQINRLSDEIVALKEERRAKSAALQQVIFEHYYFLNQFGEKKSLADIFQKNSILQPPAGAGECAAPKLLHYAFTHGLKPITMAEFWWGRSPAGKITRHQHFYPACRGKCEPILAHMLEGIEMDENPMLKSSAGNLDIKILYEDDHLLLINKPSSLLSVPGKNVSDSVYYRMKRRYPDATGPLVVHRLDMSTSGLMLISKTSEVHKLLQSQFIKRTIKKRYVALLDGKVQGEEGFIDLPLRVDLDDRPRQLVCYEHGKPARTEWKVIARVGNQTKVHFFPITGRTHQLRVHSAHPDGLNTPILGDDIYGIKGDRLYLHAEYLEFTHPISREKIKMQVDAEF